MNKNKKIRMYYMGKRMKDVYLHKTKWQLFVLKVKHFIKVCFWCALLVAIIIGIFESGSYLKPQVVYKQVEKEVILDNLTGKVNQLKGELVQDIRNCEGGGYVEDDGLIIFDSNKVASIGVYQFQKKTVIHYYKQFYNQELTGKEAILLALDEEKANELATKIIFEAENGLSNWYNCSKKINGQGRLNIIKELEN